MLRYPVTSMSSHPSLSIFAVLLWLVDSGQPVPAADATLPAADEPYYEWSVENLSITKPIGGKQGDAVHGRKLSWDRGKGNCIACHALPIPEAEFPGDLGPPLIGVGQRLTEGQIRLRVVDSKQINPLTIMPGYYRDPKLLQFVKKKYRGKTLLSAQEIEDLVAYLVTLR